MVWSDLILYVIIMTAYIIAGAALVAGAEKWIFGQKTKTTAMLEKIVSTGDNTLSEYKHIQSDHKNMDAKLTELKLSSHNNSGILQRLYDSVIKNIGENNGKYECLTEKQKDIKESINNINVLFKELERLQAENKELKKEIKMYENRLKADEPIQEKTLTM